eukprot:368912_1
MAANLNNDEVDEKYQQNEESNKISSPYDIFTNKNKDEDKCLPKEIEECFKTGLEATLEAGELISKYINDTASKSQSLITKMTKSDFQTQFDTRTEKLIVAKIKSKFPSHNIIAEESANNDETIFSDNVTWIIDPIDGTTNFLHGHNNVAICIGIKYKKISVLGIVYIPIWNELYFAVKGKGAYIMLNANASKINEKNACNIEQIFTRSKHAKISKVNELESAMVLLESGYKRDDKHCKLFSNIIYELLYKYKIRGIRMFGCCSVHMCCIASGRADVFFETGNLKPWDMVAGQVIVNEAGGYMLLPNGDAFICTKGEILCCQSKETAELLINLNILQ